MAIKTLHLTNYWHEHSGGIATFYRNLMEAAQMRQHRMVLVVPGERDELVEEGTCRIYKIAAPPSPFNSAYRTIYPYEFIFPGSKIQRILADERPDLVELCDKYSLVYLGLLLRQRLLRDLNFRPVLVGLTCERMDDNFAAYASRARWGKIFTRFYMRHIYFPAFDSHIAVSERTAAELKDVSKGHLVRRGVWIRPMGVAEQHFSPSKRCLEFRKQFIARNQLPENAVLMLYVGRLVPEKNLELLVSTMAELRNREQNFCLMVAGDGISRSTLEAAAKSRVPGKVIFLGHISDRNELARLYANCDVFVHPNPAEPFGIAPLEAMASGLPLVAPNRGGVTEYANAGNSFLVPPTAEAFARAIVQARQADPCTTQKTQAARKAAEALAWPKVTESFLHLYEELYRVASGVEAIEAAHPAFISVPAKTAKAGGLRLAATIARWCFQTYVQAHLLMPSFHLSRKVCFQTKLEDIRTQ
jgi:alpha-1,6-mannosyltransferase